MTRGITRARQITRWDRKHQTTKSSKFFVSTITLLDTNVTYNDVW